ncbi:hypothetical protein [Pleurocapsa sp. FMAR1]|uniref:hypothetical protein n=1 Tax=Pleurocapsa sp. FMAR1 TaxID=3040204 RepID=UPI0029C8C935|nr:hypothetical protein [Pleurocapsa sp. FMAR1]
MSEVNNNAASVNSESDVEFIYFTDDYPAEDRNKVRQIDSSQAIENDSNSSDSNFNQDEHYPLKSNSVEQQKSSQTKMNWQKVAHKLREYSRNLLKNVFRLEQELADINNKFSKQIEKARSSDLLVAQQAEEIETYQVKIADLNQQITQKLSGFLQTTEKKKAVIDNLVQQNELFQQQTAQLERECTLLQESCNNQAYELTAKDEEIKDLKAKLSQQQRHTIQHKAELKHYTEKVAESNQSVDQNPVVDSNQTDLHRKSIKPWTAYATSETKLSLPQTKPSVIANQTVKTAAEIATWSASTSQQVAKPKTAAKSSLSKKPQSLAAVDLPTFPRRT